MHYRVLAATIVLTFFVMPASAQSGSRPDSQPGDYTRVYIEDPITEGAVIKSLSRPSYTKAARAGKVEGKVVLRIVLASSGKVSRVTPVEVLPSGLTEKAVEAALKTKFELAKINGRPVSMYYYLIYRFSLSRGVKVVAKDEI